MSHQQEAIPVFYVEKTPRKTRQGVEYHAVTYIDADGKRHRVKQETCLLHCRDLESAKAWARSQSATETARREEHARKLAWKAQYHDFQELLDLYTAWQKRKAPNSWEGNVYYLEHWVFAYFLTDQHVGNINNWHLKFETFRDWLRRPDAVVRKRVKAPLAVSTCNNIIKTLNTFLTCLAKYGKIDPAHANPCPAFPDHETAHRTADDVIPREEHDLVMAKLVAMKRQGVADFFTVMWHTGMRFSELFGLPITGLFKGAIDNKAMHDELTKCGVTYIGYIYLHCQPEHDDRRRRSKDDKEAPHKIDVKPLKGRRTMEAKDARIIPIREKETWNILARRFKTQTEELLKKTYGGDKTNYVFFDDLTWNETLDSLRDAYKSLGMTAKPYHCCRHSYVTRLVGETRSFFLVRAITGHKKDSSFERYLHIFEQVALSAKQKDQVIDIVDL